MQTIFLGERNLDVHGSLEMGMQYFDRPSAGSDYNSSAGSAGSEPSISGLSSSQDSLDSFQANRPVGLVTNWLEVWDYVGGARFRGFVAENEGERSLFVFFDRGVIGSDLKPGYVYFLLVTFSLNDLHNH